MLYFFSRVDEDGIAIAVNPKPTQNISPRRCQVITVKPIVAYPRFAPSELRRILKIGIAPTH
jgi:hypothetical protein